MEAIKSTLTSMDSWLWPETDDRRLWNARFQFGNARTSAIALLVFRMFAFVWMFSIQVWEWNWQQDGFYHLAYLTNSSMQINLLYFLMASCISVSAFASSANINYELGAPPGAPQPRDVGALHSFAWTHGKRLCRTFLGIAISWEILVVILFWALLFTSVGQPPSLWLLDNIDLHGTSVLFPLIDMIVGANLLWDSLCIPIFFGAICYLFMNLGVSRTVAVVYSVLAWDKGSDAILVLGSLLGIVIFYFGAAWIVTSVDKCALRRAAAAQRSTTTASAPSSKTPSSLWFCPVTDFVDSPEAAAWTCRSTCAKDDAEGVNTHVLGRGKEGNGGVSPAAGAATGVAIPTGKSTKVVVSPMSA